MGKIRKAVDIIPEAINELKGYVTGEKKPIITRYEHLNNNTYGGILPGMTINISGTSGTGKSFVLQEIEEDFLNPVLNPGAENHILLRCSWEMVLRSLLVRSIRKELTMSIKDIYYKEKTKEQQEVIDRIMERESGDRIYYMKDPAAPREFEEEVSGFLTEHKDAKHILVSLDHLGLVEGTDKLSLMNELAAVINKLNVSGKFPNVTFIILIQMNRGIEDRTDKRHLSPRRSDIYGTDSAYQNAALFIVLHRPERLNHEQYMEFSPEKFPHLKQFMVKPDARRTSFKTEGLMFWHYLKLREEDETMDDLYIHRLSEQAKVEIEKEYTSKNIAHQYTEDNVDEDVTDEEPLPF